MMFLKTLFLFLVFAAISLPVSASADELRGRLPDGRAFRTDTDGTQLVDYIAELELTIDALNRRVNGLEYELEEKDKRIARLQRSGGRENSVQERDLFPRQDQVFALEQQQQTSEADIQQRLRPLEQELAQKIAETQKLTEELEVLRYANEQYEIREKKGARSDLNNWQQERQELERQIASLKLEAKSRESQHAQELAGLRQERDQVATQVSSKDEELKAQQARLRDIEEKHKAESGTGKQLVAMQQRAGSDSPRRAPQQPPMRAAVSAQQDNLTASRMRAVETLKGSINGELDDLSRLIASRDRLYQEYSKTERTVGFRPGRAQSSNNRSIQTIKSEMARATSVHHLTPLRSDIVEIKKKMQDDIDFINRMMKMN